MKQRQIQKQKQKAGNGGRGWRTVDGNRVYRTIGIKEWRERQAARLAP